jgi:hypothetical protein
VRFELTTSALSAQHSTTELYSIMRVVGFEPTWRPAGLFWQPCLKGTRTPTETIRMTESNRLPYLYPQGGNNRI